MSELRLLRHTPHEVVVVKPAGLVCEAPRDPGALSLVRLVRERCGAASLRLVHRLDRPARGVVLIAADAAAAAYYSARIRGGEWHKWYLARVAARGAPDPRLLGVHRAYLEVDGKRARQVRSGGKPSLLAVEAQAPAPGRPGESHLLVRLLTGRYHQLRVMLAGLGAPLVGDALYGGPPGTFYLEHAALVCQPFGEAAPAAFYLADDPARELVAPDVLAVLRAGLAAAAAGALQVAGAPQPGDPSPARDRSR